METRSEYAQWRDELAGERPRRPMLAIFVACAVFALFAGYVLARGGAVDHTHYEVHHVPR